MYIYILIQGKNVMGGGEMQNFLRQQVLLPILHLFHLKKEEEEGMFEKKNWVAQLSVFFR